MTLLSSCLWIRKRFFFILSNSHENPYTFTFHLGPTLKFYRNYNTHSQLFVEGKESSCISVWYFFYVIQCWSLSSPSPHSPGHQQLGPLPADPQLALMAERERDMRKIEVQSPSLMLNRTGPRLNIKGVFPGMGISIIKIRRSWDRLIFIMDFHHKDKTVVRSSHLYRVNNGNSYTRKTTYLYWDEPLFFLIVRNYFMSVSLIIHYNRIIMES